MLEPLKQKFETLQKVKLEYEDEHEKMIRERLENPNTHYANWEK